MTHFQQTFHTEEQVLESGTSAQSIFEPDPEHTLPGDSGSRVPDDSSGFAHAMTLQTLSSGIQGGESPLQFSETISRAHQQFGNRAVLQFTEQQMHLHDRAGSGIHDIARAGVQGVGENYPFQEQIQQAFGAHDVSGLRAHTGTAARTANAVLGSNAYHKGGDVAFGSAPTLSAAAHEAAHYVQNVGATQLEGGVGETNDRYERHANAVAEKVVRGESVEGLLDQTPDGTNNSTLAQSNGPVQMMWPRLGALTGLSGIGRRAAGSIAPRIPRVTRHEAMSRRREVSVPQMNELYARLNMSHFGYEQNRSKVIGSGLLKGIGGGSSSEAVASRFNISVLTKDSEHLEGIDRVMTEGFTEGGVEPLTTALMDPDISRNLNKEPLTKESFGEFVRNSREYLQDDELGVVILVNPTGAPDGWEVAGVTAQYLEGYIATNPNEQEEFSQLSDEERAQWIAQGRAIPRGQDFGEKVMSKYPWTEHLGGTLDMFDTKELLYGDNPITCQDNLAYPFMSGVDPRYQGFGVASLLFQALEAQNYAKGIDATMAEYTSISRLLGRSFNWKKHKEVLYKDYLVWRYLTSDGKYDIPPEGGRYTREEMASKGLTGEHQYAPWANINWEGPPHNQTISEPQYKPDPRYSSGWHSGPGGKANAIPTVFRGGVAAYKTFPLPELALYDESILTAAARKKRGS